MADKSVIFDLWVCLLILLLKNAGCKNSCIFTGVTAEKSEFTAF